MLELIKFDYVDFKALLENNTSNLCLNFKSRILDELNNDFTEYEKRWHVASFYVYLNYDPIKDFPIHLDNIWKLIGFSHKSNAKRTLTNNFTENEDYKITITSSDDAKPKETIILNMDTFKNLCMLTKTEKAKEIRNYYINLENLFIKLFKEELKTEMIIQ